MAGLEAGVAEPLGREQPWGTIEDLVVPDALELDETDERQWVPPVENVCPKPLLLSVAQGYSVNLLRVRRSGVVSRRREAGPVHAFPAKRRWSYLEHDWVADANGYTFEPSVEAHTLAVPEDVEETVTLFHATETCVYADSYRNEIGFADVFTKLEAARAHYADVGLGADHIDRCVR